MESKEHLLNFFLQGKINLSDHDRKFMTNLQMLIHTNNRITSNQSSLFDNLIHKYMKQLSRVNLFIDELMTLSWKTMIVESTSEYTGATVTITGNHITIKVPYKKKFITEFKDIPYNTFKWNKEDKLYKADFSTEALRIAVTRLHTYFTTVQFCDNTKAILAQLKKYESIKFWDPMLVRLNGRLFVVACNPIIGELIKDIELNLEGKTLYQLSQYGIKIHPELLADDTRLNFCASRVVEVELDKIEQSITWMKEIGCTHVMIGRGLRHDKNPKRISIIRALEKQGIFPIPYLHESNDDMDVISIQFSSNFKFPDRHVNKIILLKDLTPVEVR